MLLTYKQAAEILDITYQAVRFAVTEERLTKVVTKKGPRVLEEQVQLFIGKPGISEMFLTIEEKKKWKEYKEQADKYSMTESNFQETLVELIKSIEQKPTPSDGKIALMEKINNHMEEIIKLMEAIGNDTKIDIIKDKKEDFPLSASTLKNA